MRCDVRVLVGWKGDGGEQLVENIGSKQVNTGLQPFTENLLTTSLTIRHTISDVMGAKERKRSAIKMSRASGVGAPLVAELTSETF